MTLDVTVRVPASLREVSGGASAVTVAVDEPPTVRRVLDALAVALPALERRVRDELGTTRPHVNLFVDAENVRDLDGLDTLVRAGQTVTIVPAVSGG